MPIRDGVADVILNIFAPRNLSEFHRILAPNGTLVVVVPRAEHLQELRENGRMLDVPADKAPTLIESARDQFTLVASTSVVLDIAYDEVLAESLVAHGAVGTSHAREPARSGRSLEIPAHATVTAAVDVLAFAAR